MDFPFDQYAQESESFTDPIRGPDGRFLAVEEALPMDANFIGQFSSCKRN
jgi:hypothetical protein